MSAENPRWYDAGVEHIWLPYTNMTNAPPPVPVVKTDGVRLTLADGRVLIDGIASWWTAVHGYNHPHILAAMHDQIERMPHVMFAGLVHEPALILARRLSAMAPGDLNHVFFADSGSVSVEVAMKMAIQYWLNEGVTGRNKFVSFMNGYHGDTMATMAVCDPEKGMHRQFRDYLPEQFVIDLPADEEGAAQFDRLLRANCDQIAAVIIEPLVQGAGGMKFHEPAVLQHIRRACDGNDILLIADEIFTGFGRTGTMFAVEQAGIAPDLMCLSKALTGGVISLAAVLANDRVFGGFQSDDPEIRFNHGPTYMANPLACAAANASLDLFETEPRLGQVADIEKQLKEELAPCRDLPGVVDVRARGAIGVVQLEELRHADWLKRRFVEEGVWLRPFVDMVYVTPPYIISGEDLSTLTGAITRILGEWAEK